MERRCSFRLTPGCLMAYSTPRFVIGIRDSSKQQPDPQFVMFSVPWETTKRSWASSPKISCAPVADRVELVARC
jgi:hypothetical protein